MSADEPEDDWEEVWNARVEALECVLDAKTSPQVFHAPHPFELGGNADVLAFPDHKGGYAYVTAELTGKPTACFADYELMICHRSPDDWGPNIISRLAAYTQQAHIGATETMDIGGAAPKESTISAFLFDTYAQFDLFGSPNEIRLCIGITPQELEFKMKHGGSTLLSLLNQQGVYPFTDLNRPSISLT